MAAQGLRDVAGLLRALRGVLLQAMEDDLLQFFPDLGAERAGRLRDFMDDAVIGALRAANVEVTVAREAGMIGRADEAHQIELADVS